jgi:iron complex outermembrane receptor protein
MINTNGQGQALFPNPNDPTGTELLGIIQNGGRSYTEGVELETYYNPIQLPGLSLAASLGLMHRECQHNKNQETVPNTSPPVIQTVELCGKSGHTPGGQFPELMLNTRASYTTPPTPWGPVTFAAEYFYISQVYIQGSPHRRYDKIDAYGLVNARLALEHEKYGLEYALFVKNALDRVYLVGGLDLRSSLGWAHSYYGAPRTFGVEVTYRFGADRI